MSFDFRKSPLVVISVVLPASPDLSLSGRVRNITIRAEDNSGWLERSETAEFGWDLKQSYKAQGYMLLGDCFRLEGDEAGWEMYKRYVRQWKAGKTTKSFPIDYLPKEVVKRQRGEHLDSIDPWDLPPRPTTGEATDPDKVVTTKPARVKTRKAPDDLGDEE